MPIVTITVQGEEEAVRKIDRYHGFQLNRSLQKATAAATKVYVMPMRAAAPRADEPHRGRNARPPGALAASVRSRKARPRYPGEIAPYVVGPTIWYRHFPILGVYGGQRKAPEYDFVGRVATALRPASTRIFDVVLSRELNRP